MMSFSLNVIGTSQNLIESNSRKKRSNVVVVVSRRRRRFFTFARLKVRVSVAKKPLDNLKVITTILGDLYPQHFLHHAAIVEIFRDFDDGADADGRAENDLCSSSKALAVLFDFAPVESSSLETFIKLVVLRCAVKGRLRTKVIERNVLRKEYASSGFEVVGFAQNSSILEAANNTNTTTNTNNRSEQEGEEDVDNNDDVEEERNRLQNIIAIAREQFIDDYDDDLVLCVNDCRDFCKEFVQYLQQERYQ
jgi:hypothetical protein